LALWGSDVIFRYKLKTQMYMGQVIAITVMKRGYQQIIYVNAENVQVKNLGSFDELDKTEQQLFGNTDLGNNYAVFDWESLD